MKKYLYILSLLVSSVHVIAQESPRVLATSSWTGAYLELAGIRNYEILAPSMMQHPTDYELQLKDIDRLRKADLIVCGGYESMMNDIREGLKIAPEKILQIKTDYYLANIRSAVMTLAERAGNTDMAARNLEIIDSLYDHYRGKWQEMGGGNTPVIVQYFLVPIAKEIGMDIRGIFGPRALEAYEIGELMGEDFRMILDNAHNPAAGPLAETRKESMTIELLNFPGTHGTKSVQDVIIYNRNEVFKTMNKLK